MKKAVFAFVAAAALLLSALCGCGTVSGADGRNGQDLNIYEIYEEANSARREQGLEEIGFLDFLNEYLHYDYSYSSAESAQALMNRSLMSCVSILTGFGKSYGSEYYAGAGVIVELDKEAGDAYVLTNCHVVYDDSYSNIYADEIRVYLYGSDDITTSADYITAELVGATVTYDLALLRITGSEILKNSDAKAAEFSSDEEVYVGEPVYAIGNPEGMGMTLTEGIVSKESAVIPINLSSRYPNNPLYNKNYRVLMTDAAVNGGNSGGGLFNSNGYLVGLINSKAVSSLDGEDINDVENMGFALPASYVKRIWKLMRDGYSANNSHYGLRRSVFPAEYSYTSSSYFDSEKSRAVITDKVVVSGMSAPIAVLRGGDLIKNVKVLDGDGNVVENMPVTRYFNIDDALLSARAGYNIVYTVVRNGNEMEITTSPRFKSCE